MIYQLRKEYSVQAMCTFFRVSRAGYYGWVRRMERVDADGERMQLVQQAYQRSRRTYGYRRIAYWLRREYGRVINPKAVLRLMQKMGLRSIARRRKVWHAAGFNPDYRYANVLNRNFTATQPNQKWVTDITWIQTQHGLLYLSVIKDLYDGFIVAHAATTRNSVDLVTTTLQQALRHQSDTKDVILHSDQGAQYCSQDYFRMTHEAQITPSMSRRGNCWDNAPMENFFGHLKSEAIRPVKLETLRQAQEVIDDYIHFYNYERIQLKTKLTPYEYRCQSR